MFLIIRADTQQAKHFHFFQQKVELSPGSTLFVEKINLIENPILHQKLVSEKIFNQLCYVGPVPAKTYAYARRLMAVKLCIHISVSRTGPHISLLI